jgi:hypothetical protein
MDLESLLTSPNGFRLTTATPLQRAICRASQGKPTGLSPEDAQRHFGIEPTQRPSMMVLICGVRSGKSLIAGAAAFYSALTADLSKLPLHERSRVVVCAPTVANSETTFRLLTGAVNAAPALKALVVGEPTSGEMTVRREDGRHVDILVVAAHRGAVALRGTWLAGYILEEVAFFGDNATGYIVNGEELLRAASTRLVPGGQGFIISSPMGPSGLLYNLWRTHFGKPGEVLVCHAPTMAMNSVTVSPGVIEELRLRDPDAASREFDAVWADQDTALIPAAHIDAAMRCEEILPYVEGHTYTAAMDPATRGNAWTLVVCSLYHETPHQRIVFAKEWIGSKVKPLSPDAVLAEQAQILRDYHLDRCATDQHAADANKDIARRHRLYLYDIASTREENIDLFTSLATKFADGEVELPPDHVLRNDLLGIRKKVSSRVTIVLLKTPDGRHCDYAPAIARVLSMGCRPPTTPKPKLGTPEHEAMLRAEEKAEALASARKHARMEDKEANKAAKAKNWSYFDPE